MARSAVVAGTGYEGRAGVIRAHCHEGARVVLRRDPANLYDSNAIAVVLPVPRLFGLLGTAYRQIGFVKAGTARFLAKRMDAGELLTGTVSYLLAPEGRDVPKVTIEIEEAGDDALPRAQRG